MKGNITGEIYSGQSMTGETTVSNTIFIEPNMEIGTVETTEEAEASITGIRPNFVLNLGIPKGERGEKGDTGASFTYDMFTDEQLESLRGEPGKDGSDGKDGYTPVKGVDYFDGVDGKNGTDGYTPVKGVDYFDGVDGVDGVDGKDGSDYVLTEADKQEIASIVLAEFPSSEGVSY